MTDPTVVSSAVFRRLVRSRTPVFGTFIKIPSIDSVDVISGSGFDFAVVDLEHSQLSDEACSLLVRHAAAIGLPVVVRMPAVDAALINRALEAGAAGVQVSSLQRVGEIKDLVAASRYPPSGTRSASTAQPAAQFGKLSLNEYLSAESAAPPLLVGQVESATTADPLDSLAESGLDVVFVGTTDLSVDLGAPGRSEHAPFIERLREIAGAAMRSQVAFGGFANGSRDCEQLIGLGATYLIIGSDIHALRDGLSRLIAEKGSSSVAETPSSTTASLP